MSTRTRRRFKAGMVRAGRNIAQREALVKRAKATPFLFVGGHWMDLKRSGFSRKEALTLELQRLRANAGNVPDAELRGIARENVYHAYDKGRGKAINRHFAKMAHPTKVPKTVRREMARLRRKTD